MPRRYSKHARIFFVFTLLFFVGLALVKPELFSRKQVAQTVVFKVHGLNFSPFVDGQDPNLGSSVTVAQLTTRLQIIANHTVWVRSFGSSRGLENFGMVAHSLGLKAAAGAWLSSDTTANNIEIANLIAAANAGHVDLAIVGSEVLLRNDLTETQLIGYMNQVRQQIPAHIPVATADVFGKLLEHPNVIAASDVILPNFYPYWSGDSVNIAIATLHRQYQLIVAASNGKPIIVSETGWPSAGNTICNAVPSPENAAFYFLNFVSWARANNVQYFYFNSLDETWKAKYEGPQGAHWGVWTKDGVLKPGMQRVFDGETIADNWTNAGLPGGAGTPKIEFVHVPPFGTETNLFGQVFHVNTDDHKVAVYIRVAGLWWTKPTFANPVTNIGLDGAWECDITTGGNDPEATEIVAFLIPKTFTPPQVGGQPTLPSTLDQNAVAKAQITRSSSTPYIAGRVINSNNNQGLSCVTMSLTGTQTATTRTVLNGHFSFLNLPVGNYTLTPSHPSFLFEPPSMTFNNLTTGQNVVFSAAPKPTPTPTATPTPTPTPTPSCSQAQLTSPSNGANISSTTTFTWNTGTGNVEFWLTAGTQLGAGNIFDGSLGLNTSKTLNSLPSGQVFVRLWSRCGATNAWPSTDYTFTVAGGTPTPTPTPACNAAQITSPTNNSNIPATTTFTWNTGTGNVEFWLTVGTSAGGGNIFDGSQGLNTSKTLSGLPAGPIFVRLWSKCANNWPFRDFTFTVGSSSTPTPTPTPTAGYSVAASPASVSSGANITVNWTAPSGHSTTDWIGLYRAGTADSAFLTFQYLTSGTSGTMNFVAPATAGVYEFRCFPNNGFTRVATSNSVTVGGGASGVNVVANPANVGPGATVTVNWSSSSTRAANDWIGLYLQGAADTSFISFQYIGAPGTSGSKTFTMPGKNGVYEFRYFLTDTYTKAGTSNAVTLTGGVP